jgi:hypothetical protein
MCHADIIMPRCATGASDEQFHLSRETKDIRPTSAASGTSAPIQHKLAALVVDGRAQRHHAGGYGV